jgi:hypothetical protein
MTATFTHRPLFGWRCRLWIKNKVVGTAWGEDQFQALDRAMLALNAVKAASLAIKTVSDTNEEISTWAIPS